MLIERRNDRGRRQPRVLTHGNINHALAPITPAKLLIALNAASLIIHRLSCTPAMGDEPPPPIPGTLHLRSGGKLTIYGHEYTVVLEGERDVRLVDRFNREEVLSLGELHTLRKKGVLQGDALRVDGNPNLLADFSAEEIDKARAKVEAIEAGRSDRFSGGSISRFRAKTAGAVSLIDKMLRLIDRTRDRGRRADQSGAAVRRHAVCALAVDEQPARTPFLRSAAGHLRCRRAGTGEATSRAPRSVP